MPLALVACSSIPTGNNPIPGNPTSTLTDSAIDVTGRWEAQNRKSTGEVNSAVVTLTQAAGNSSFTGFLRFTSIDTSNASISGDVKTGVFKISEIGGPVYIDVTGKFSSNFYAGSYVAHYSDGSTPGGTIFMSKAPPTSKLAFTVNGLVNEFASVTISDSQRIIYGGSVSTATVFELPKTTLTIKAQDTQSFLAPPAQTVDLSTGDKSVTLNYRQRPLQISMFDQTLEIYRKGRATIRSFLVPASDFSGTVEIRLQNLPPGVQQVAPVSVTVNGKPIDVNVPIVAAADTKFADTEVNVMAVAGADSSSVKLILQTRPELIVPVPSNSHYSWTVAPDGHLYVTSPTEEAVFRVNPDGSRELIVKGPFSWADELKAGPDGSLWVMRAQPIRIDPIAKTQEAYPCPVSLSCSSFAITIDSKKRAWGGHFELQRTNLLTGEVSAIPEAKGKDFNQRGQIVGDTYWGFYEATVLVVNTDTLAAKTYTFPGISSVYNFNVRGNTLAFTGVSNTSNLGDYGLYTFDTSTGILTPHPIENQPRVQVLGQDSNGILWVSGSKWLRYDPKSKQVLQEMPALSSTTMYVTPNGDIWYVTTKGFFFVARQQ